MQAVFSLPQFSPIELLLADYEVAIEEKKRAYALSEVCADAESEAAEAACDKAYNAAEDVGDMILALPARSTSELAIKARVLSARDPDHQVCYRPEYLIQFVQEVRSLVAKL